MPSFFERLSTGAGLAWRAPAPGEAKASLTGPLIALHTQGRPVWTSRDFSALAREGFQKNPIVYRCVRMISEAAASLTWLAYEDGRELDTHPLLGLIAKPNPAHSGADLLESVYGYLLIAGNAYLEVVAVDGEARELHGLRPDRMKVVPGANGWPEAYEYSVGGQKVRFAVPDADAGADTGAMSPVLHLSLFHPLDDHYGFSPLEAAQVPIDTHNTAGAWNKALLDNAARPSGALIYRPAEPGAALTGDQYERLKQELEDSFQGSGNAGRPLLLEGGLDWKSMGLTPRDMDFIDAKHAAARDIALTFGVPPMLLGIPGDATYANYQEANRAFWRQTVLPLANRVAKSIENWFAPTFGDDLRLAYDLDQVSALSVERETLWSRLQAADFLTANEKRAAVGYAPLPQGDPDPAGDGDMEDRP